MWILDPLVPPENRQDPPETWCPCWPLASGAIDPGCPEHGHLDPYGKPDGREWGDLPDDIEPERED